MADPCSLTIHELSRLLAGREISAAERLLVVDQQGVVQVEEDGGDAPHGAPTRRGRGGGCVLRDDLCTQKTRKPWQNHDQGQ